MGHRQDFQTFALYRSFLPFYSISHLNNLRNHPQKLLRHQTAYWHVVPHKNPNISLPTLLFQVFQFGMSMFRADTSHLSLLTQVSRMNGQLPQISSEILQVLPLEAPAYLYLLLHFHTQNPIETAFPLHLPLPLLHLEKLPFLEIAQK